MIAENQTIIDNFIEHLKLGKPLGMKSKKPISDLTAYKYRSYLSTLDTAFNKPFSELTSADIDTFRKKLNAGEIKTSKGKIYDNGGRDLIVKALRPMLIFIGKYELSLFTPPLKKHKEIPALRKEEVEKVIANVKLRDKLIWQLLFDGGFRADEFLNVKFSDIKDDNLKSDGFYKIRITTSKTLPRTIGLTLPLSTELIKEWLSQNSDKIGTNAKFVDISYRHFNLCIRRHGANILKKKCYPHLLRHSSATYFCHQLNQYQMCKRYGWAMASDMPQQYIDREGIDEEFANKKMVAEENMSHLKEINKLKEQLSLQNELQQKDNEDSQKFREQIDSLNTEKLAMQKQLAELTKKMEFFSNFENGIKFAESIIGKKITQKEIIECINEEINDK